ncbi:LysR substrate-binding domain-containing protein [Streptomyces hokutonensis]|uniref:LysR substrate-binding domain-containing protein n=1 Tax=Streptomyces hokutonensis TaxID=1306990 RepID=UPI0034E25083
MRRVPLLTDRRCVLLPADHPAAASPTVSLAELAGERRVLKSGRTRFLAACRDAGFVPRTAATADDQLTLHSPGRQPHRSRRHERTRRDGTLRSPGVARPLTDWPVRRVFALLWPDTLRIPAAAALLGALRNSARRTAAPWCRSQEPGQSQAGFTQSGSAQRPGASGAGRSGRYVGSCSCRSPTLA